MTLQEIIEKGRPTARQHPTMSASKVVYLLADLADAAGAELTDEILAEAETAYDYFGDDDTRGFWFARADVDAR